MMRLYYLSGNVIAFQAFVSQNACKPANKLHMHAQFKLLLKVESEVHINAMSWCTCK